MVIDDNKFRIFLLVDPVGIGVCGGYALHPYPFCHPTPLALGTDKTLLAMNGTPYRSLNAQTGPVRSPVYFHSKKSKAGTFVPALIFGGLEGDRTLDLTDANRTLSQTELRARVIFGFFGLCNRSRWAPS